MNAKDTSLKKRHESLDWRNKDPEYKKFADIVSGNIKRLMKAKKISQLSLVNVMSERYEKANNWSEQSQVSKRINGREFISAYDLYRIASILEVSVEELVYEPKSCSTDNGFNNTIIKNIRELMTLASPEISEEKLGEIVGLTQYDVGKCMGGSDTFTLEQISKIADYFSVSVDYLMGRNTYSNFEICSLLSNLIERKDLEIKELEKTKVSALVPRWIRFQPIYLQLQDIIHRYKSGEEWPKSNLLFPELDRDVKDIVYLAMYFPMYESVLDGNNHIPLQKNEKALRMEGDLNLNNLIINQFLEKYNSALKDYKKRLIAKKDFDNKVKSFLTEVVQLSLVHRN